MAANVWAIAKREFASYFNSAIAYLSIAVFLVMVGAAFFWWGPPLEEGGGFFEAGQASMRTFFQWIPLLFIFLLPAISMRLMSEEKRTGSFELLITMPVRDIEVLLGKLLGAFMFLEVALALTLAYPVAISMLGPLDWGPVIGGYIGSLLLGLAYLSIGLMTSCWTRNQIVAFLLSVMICTFFYFIDEMAGAFEAELRETVAVLSFKAHFANVARGVLDTRDVIFYLSVTTTALIIGNYSVESRRYV
ncbi:MAG: ABC-2 type transport system permease protein [Myxococcota bacterium]|jgi:ABC-2 type transport system permease protein